MEKSNAIFMQLYRITFAPVRNHTECLLFRYKNGDFSAISVTEQRCVAPISKVESHISERCLHYTGEIFVSAQKAIQHSVNIA